jgi:isopenicillin-N epimerase
LPSDRLFDKNPEAWWKSIREEQFLLPGWRCFMNNGSLGVAPRPVVEAVTKYLERAAGLLVEGYPRWGYETLDEERAEYAEFFGCKKDELAFVHNATEAMSIIAAGLDLKAGDEILMTDQEHGSGKNPWLLRQARHGVTVREVPLPLPPKSQEQLTDVLISAIGPRTRVLSFSGITTTTGLILPVREICTAARAKGVITVVDAAHMHGQTPTRMADFNCDFLAGSPHKWVYAPAGCGLLYIREEMLDRLWPTIVTGGWDDPKLKAARFMRVGTNSRAIFVGLMAGLQFLKQLGPQRVYSRIHQLARVAFDQARKEGLPLLTPDDDRMFAGLVTFNLDKEHAARFLALCEKRKIWAVGSPRMRVSTHIHTRPQDIELFFETLRETRA